MHSRIVIENISDCPKEVEFFVKQNETLYYLVYGFSDTIKRVSVILAGEGAEAYIFGILMGYEGTCGLTTLQNHRVPNTKSDLLVRTVLGGSATFKYQGKIVIERDAQRSNAYQRNENILMSAQAHVDTKPELEILANDVRCTHGATVGKLDEEQIYYLQSRGLQREESADLILRGFMGEVIMRIPDNEIQEKIRIHANEWRYAKLT